jgi:hypothetical protein
MGQSCPNLVIFGHLFGAVDDRLAGGRGALVDEDESDDVLNMSKQNQAFM